MTFVSIKSLRLGSGGEVRQTQRLFTDMTIANGTRTVGSYDANIGETRLLPGLRLFRGKESDHVRHNLSSEPWTPSESDLWSWRAKLKVKAKPSSRRPLASPVRKNASFARLALSLLCARTVFGFFPLGADLRWRPRALTTPRRLWPCAAVRDFDG